MFKLTVFELTLFELTMFELIVPTLQNCQLKYLR